MTMNPLFDLAGRTALITGGSRGLGLQIAEALGEAGARLVISSGGGVAGMPTTFGVRVQYRP